MTKIDIYEFDEFVIINFSLNILVSNFGLMKLSSMSHQSQLSIEVW